MNKYWLTLYPETFLWIKGENGFVYNSLNHSSYSFKAMGKLKEWSNELSTLENLYTISIYEKDLQDDEKARQWIQSVININGGFLTVAAETEKKPVSLKPVLKLQKKTEFFKLEHIRGSGGALIKNIHELTFYINNSKKYGSDTYYSQTKFPLRKCGHLDLNKILAFALHSRNPNLTHVNLVGNIFTYPEFHLLLDGLTERYISYIIHITLQDFTENFKMISEIQWTDNVQFNVLFDSMPDQLVPLQDFQPQIGVSVLVFSESCYETFSLKFKNLPVYCDAQFIPVYNGMNFDFFESNVFTDSTVLENMALSKRDIFIRQALNILNFGRLTIMPDGLVYSNVNHRPLGTIDDTVYSLVYKEFTEGQSWLQIRDQFPCTDCVYQWLCPSPSSYETLIGRPNLCYFKP